MNKQSIGTIIFLSIMTLTHVVMAGDYAARAAEEHKAGHHQRASTLYKATLRADKDNVTLLQNIVECETVLGHLDDALKYAERARVLSPQSIEILLATGYLYQRKNNWEAARTTYESILALDPENSTTLVRMSEVMVNLGDEAAAQGYLDQYTNSTGRE